MSHSFHDEISIKVKRGNLPSFAANIMRKFFDTYVESAVKNGYSVEDVEHRLLQLLHFTVKQIAYPYRFGPYHKKITRPFNYYRFGLDFIRPLIDFSESKVINLPILNQVEEQLKKKENVIFLANHQVEPDPQVISVLLEKTHPNIAEELIFVAGQRVISDPLAVPFSLGRNLICIFSKKHVEHPPEQKAAKLVHNQRAMKKMASLLAEGGKCIYVAPSGGRDRPDSHGQIIPSAFDPQSVEMFHLMAKQSKTPTHFYPLVLSTYLILPPPNCVEKDIGEKRHAACAPVYLCFEEEVDLVEMVAHIDDKKEKRKVRAEMLTQMIRDSYIALTKGS